ncbi:uncharacterized protein LOC122500236 isoform X1 [Leptopilina heterotoma]|uniref:uncharacterized protein LOC122500236 isoform X1 n=2 Tax=Leptopilina heterotoma TaxID=63436 RepID=UPI001CA8E19A|nr:uncharacterized protein LOC122500236 isoform X1 [Leptopilina heterotoma]
MFRRKRGGLTTTRKMAKKSQPAALQAEVSTDEEWEKILEKNGLLVADIYSEWSGPCTGMVSILKKIKMEIGGDTLNYAIVKCDNIASLERFRGKSEPTWMIIHKGQMVNLVFGANCPELLRVLNIELERVLKGEPHDFSIPVSQRSPEEENRLKIIEESRLAKETAKKAQREAEAKAKYEDEINHLTASLKAETCLLLYPWILKDEEGHKRDKKSSPPYINLVDEIFPENFSIEQEFRKSIDENMLIEMFKESDYKIPKEDEELLLDGKCIFMRLKISGKKAELDVEKHLISLLFGEPNFPKSDQELIEGSYVHKHQPTAIPSDRENRNFPLVWTPLNPRNKALVFKLIFRKYLDSTYPYEDKTYKVPIIVFKYDSTRKNELKVVLEIYNSEIVHFGVFERDKPPEAKLIATNIEEFESMTFERTSFETFVCAVKKVGSEAFLAFAGIGPYHVSENPEKAIEESKLYFPTVTFTEDLPSDDEEKLEDAELAPDGKSDSETKNEDTKGH